MTTTIKTLMPRLAATGILAGAMTLFAADPATSEIEQAHDHTSAAAAPAALVNLVRVFTQQFTDVNAATAANYQPLFGCVTGPDQGAMGVHYINLTLYADGQIDSAKPEALIYEPSKRRTAAGGRGVHRGRRYLDEEQQCSAHARRSGVPVCEQPEPLRLTRVFSSCTSGHGGTTPTALSWTGTRR